MHGLLSNLEGSVTGGHFGPVTFNILVCISLHPVVHLLHSPHPSGIQHAPELHILVSIIRLLLGGGHLGPVPSLLLVWNPPEHSALQSLQVPHSVYVQQACVLQA